MPKNFTYKTEKVDANEEKTLEELEKEQKMLLEKIEALKKHQAEEKAKKEAEEKAKKEAEEKAKKEAEAREAEEKARIEREKREKELLEEAKSHRHVYFTHNPDGTTDYEHPFMSALDAKFYDPNYIRVPALVKDEKYIRPLKKEEACSIR